MKDVHKNMVALVIIVVVTVLVTEYFQLGVGWFWVMILGSITLWLIFTPFKLYDDVQ